MCVFFKFNLTLFDVKKKIFCFSSHLKLNEAFCTLNEGTNILCRVVSDK